MPIKGCKSIAEYAMRAWMQDKFVEGSVTLTINGNRGKIQDRNGDSLALVYDNETKTVYAQDQEAEL
jgi:hypothetical protein